jgi:hypothetical protein
MKMPSLSLIYLDIRHGMMMISGNVGRLRMHRMLA